MAPELPSVCEKLMAFGRFSTLPVAVKVAEEGATLPQKGRSPAKDLGNPLAVCQGVTLARTLGWSLRYGREDHGCPIPPVFLGHVAPDTFLQGGLAAYYQDEEETGRRMEASYPRWPVGSAREVWISALDRCAYEPDVILVYGNAAQILTLIQAGNFRVGTGVRSAMTGRFGCSAWLKGVIDSGECTTLVPGPGERVFGGTQDHEVSFAIPFGRLQILLEGLEYITRKGAFRYPVPNLAVLHRPKMPDNYYKVLG